MRLPRTYGSPLRLHEPTAMVPSGSYRATIVDSAAKRRPTSSATVANIAVGGAPRATSAATRRSAACSSATRRSSARDSAFAIAVATSSVKAGIRSSAARGSGSGPARAAITTRHSPPLDDDRAPAAGLHPGAPEGVGDRSGRAGEPDDARRPACAEYLDGGALALHRQPRPDHEVTPHGRPSRPRPSRSRQSPIAGPWRCLPPTVVPPRRPSRKTSPPESPPGDQRRHPAQRRLLACEPAGFLPRGTLVVQDV